MGAIGEVSQRPSGYERKSNDEYFTPSWCTEALLPHLPAKDCTIWEPACGTRKIVEVILAAGYGVVETDREHPFFDVPAPQEFRGIVTNPPYGKATEFIERSLELAPRNGFVAMLLRTDFDHAKTRRHLFGDCKHFAKKLMLTKRIRWFEGTTGSPSFNHAWYLWSKTHRGAPTLVYGP